MGLGIFFLHEDLSETKFCWDVLFSGKVGDPKAHLLMESFRMLKHLVDVSNMPAILTNCANVIMF